jgi:outer membrane protein assembly factor BamB/subtilisin family serine protease/septal ring-binding cell division protein DamX
MVWVRLILAAAAASCLACAALAVSPQTIGGLTPRELAQGYSDGRVLAKPRAEALPTIDRAEKAEGYRLRSRFGRFGSVGVLELAAGDTVAAAVKRLKATGRYEYVEPDYIRRAMVVPAVPNDPQFGSQWALHNTGANGGIAGADINAEAGWGTLSNAPGVIVGILDSGALTTHQDLVGNLWVNPNPGVATQYPSVSGTGASDSVSETDSTYGLNAVTKTGLPTDDIGHGTHVSGIVGAVGNNGLGVSGVAWKVQVMELKFLDGSGMGTLSNELPCIEYAIAHKVSVINASFGSQGLSLSEMDAIQSAGKAGIIFVCAAGNSAENIDISPFFPADYPLDNIICVGATDNRDQPVYFSNYGSGSVEIFAPGESILSTYNSSTSSYAYLSGTSMAAPFVTGAVALLRAQFPADTYRETINRVLNCADKIPGLAGKSQTGGRLNLGTALTTAANTPPNALFANRTTLAGLDPYTRSNNADSPAALEGGTPVIAGVAGSHSLWWQWTAPEDATVEIDTSGTLGGLIPGGSTYPTLLGVYTGGSLGSLALVGGDANFGTDPLEGGGGSVSYSEVSFHAAAGTTYQINVQGQNGQSGQTILAINTTPDNDSIASPKVLTGPSTSILGANSNGTLQTGEPRILGNAGGHSLWYSWTAPRTGTEQISGYSYDFVPEVAVYTGNALANLSLVTAAAGGAAKGTSTNISECLCTMNAVAGTTYLICVDGVTASGAGEFTLSIADSRWQATTGDSVTCSPAAGPDGTVYVGSDDNSLYAIDPSGNVKWTHSAGGIFDTSSVAVASDGTIYAGNTDGNVTALNPDGSVKWTYAVPTASSGAGISSSAALASDGTLYIHADDGNLYALTTAGKLKWTAALSGASYAAPTVAPSGVIYIGNDGGAFVALNPDGTQRWEFSTPVTGDPIYTAAAIDSAGNVYFGTLSGNFYSLDPTGKFRWSYTVGDGVTSAPALANGAVYFGGYDGNLYALSTSGALQWKLALGAQVRASAPAVDANGVVYIGCYDHNVYAVSSGGSLVRTYASGDWVRSSPLISGTTLYFGSNDHKVYAFDIGVGSAQSDWPMYQYDSRRLGRAEVDALAITSQPASETIAPGSTLTLSVAATGPGGLSYQWDLNGAPIAGAVNSTYTVPSAPVSDSGSYTVIVTSGSTSVTSAAAVVTVAAQSPSTARLINISTRAQVGTGGSILIPGFVIGGSGTETLLIRGDGPSLAAFGVAGVLARPSLSVFDSTGKLVASNTGWGTNANPAQIASVAAQVGAFAFASGSADCALIASLPVGAYTVQVSGVNNTTGVALAEVYEVSSGGTRLVNISTRAQVGTGANIIIPGFVISGVGSEQLLVRGDGPSLTPFGVAGVLAQPSLSVFDSTGKLIASNTGWGSSSNPSQIASVAAQVGAFAFASGSADSAAVVNLPSGAYTMQVSGVGGTTGVALAEVYEVP